MKKQLSAITNEPSIFLQGKSLVIFDMDGVLLDSEPLHKSSMFRILKELSPVYETIPADLHSHMIGKDSIQIWNDLMQNFALPPVEDGASGYLRLQYRYLLEEMQSKNIPASRGLKDLLAALHKNNIPAAVASSSESSLVYSTLEHLNIRDAFEVIVCGNEVAHKKPEPDIYLEVLKRMHCNPADALAIEDSRTGLLAASRAEIPAVGYRNPTSGNQDLSNSICMVDSLSELIPEM